MATENQKKNITEVKAFARYIHVSPRKLRLVADLVRRQQVDSALEQLRFSSKQASLPLAKAINSAVANAIHNFNLNKENLFVKAITIDQGPVFKRYAPRAQGRAFVERKRTSHINVVLESRTQPKKSRRSMFSLRPRISADQKIEREVESGKQIEPTQSDKVSNKQQQQPKQPTRPAEKRKNSLISLKRRLFNRKSGG